MKTEQIFKAAREDVARRKREATASNRLLTEHRNSIKAVLKLLGKFAEDASVGAYATHAWVVVSMRCLEGFKDPKLTAVLSGLIDMDPSAKMETKEWPQYLNRDYYFDLFGGKLTVRIGAYVKSDSETCRKVLKRIDVVTEEVKVYAMECD